MSSSTVNWFCFSFSLSNDAFIWIVAPVPGHVKKCCQSLSSCSQKQHCICLYWSHVCRLFVHQKLNTIFFIVGCLAVGILLNAFFNDDQAISFHVFYSGVCCHCLERLRGVWAWAYDAVNVGWEA
jgi:hypothetical protein